MFAPQPACARLPFEERQSQQLQTVAALPYQFEASADERLCLSVGRVADRHVERVQVAEDRRREEIRRAPMVIGIRPRLAVIRLDADDRRVRPQLASDRAPQPVPAPGSSTIAGASPCGKSASADRMCFAGVG